jgi:hypothetical protein
MVVLHAFQDSLCQHYGVQERPVGYMNAMVVPSRPLEDLSAEERAMMGLTLAGGDERDEGDEGDGGEEGEGDDGFVMVDVPGGEEVSGVEMVMRDEVAGGGEEAEEDEV